MVVLTIYSNKFICLICENFLIMLLFFRNSSIEILVDFCGQNGCEFFVYTPLRNNTKMLNCFFQFLMFNPQSKKIEVIHYQ